MPSFERERETVPASEPARQFYFMELARDLVREKSLEAGRPLRYFVQTFGCQMNARDSEKLRGTLGYIGYEEAEDEDADFVLYNTCTVRENANTRVYGRLGYLHNLKKRNPQMMIALCGCMMQEAEVVETIRSRYGFVDLIFGTHNVYQLAELLVRALSGDEMVVAVSSERERIVEDLPVRRSFSFKSGVNVMYGCDNFCSYCIVPYVRGREWSRPRQEIVEEVRRLADDGVVEVMLLGQNVNSYGKGLEEPCDFATLLSDVAKIDGIRRIRFMTSHPKDLSDELILVMRDEEKICRHLHLPLQSGSTRILEEMNRRYTKEQYLSLTERIRDAMPEISLTTDLIVGFPGETEDDFKETMDVVERVRFDSAFTFLYSKRSGTRAAKMPDQIEEAIAKERFNRLLDLVQSIGREETSRFLGETKEVLVEAQNEQDPALVTGRISENTLVHFKGSPSLIGSIVPVRLTESQGFYYIGEVN